MSLLDFHQAWAWVVIIGNGMAGVWALCAIKFVSLKRRALWWFTFFVQAAVFVQVGTGIGLVLPKHMKPPAFHPFYGFLAVIAVGIVYAYRRQLARRLYLLYGLGGLFIMGVGIRALITAK
ncbi:MAG: hypothetical protein M1483_01805 [Actinobacteria bacterium]|nr:hypothetical protein [Actinomycetota bacterium]MCL6104365.1 hypothetical protein [Actinomycetota bacterium]